MWRNTKPPQAGGLTAATTDAANMTAPELSPAIRRGATLDPAGPFEICPVCNEQMDITKSYDHRDCVPKIQGLGWYVCETCNRSPWDCRCPQWAKCVHCEVSVEDIDGPRCSESPNGDHLWMVQDGDGYKVLSWDRAGMVARSGNDALAGTPSPVRMHLTPSDSLPAKPEKGSDEWYEMMDNPKSAWRAGE